MCVQMVRAQLILRDVRTRSLGEEISAFRGSEVGGTPAAWHAREGSSAVLRSARMRARADAPGAALGRWRVGACMRRTQLQLPLPPVMSRQKWRADLMYVHMD